MTVRIMPLQSWIDRQEQVQPSVTKAEIIRELKIWDHTELRRMLSTGNVFIDPQSLDIYRKRPERRQRHG